MTLVVSRRDLQTIQDHSRSSFPAEACGVLVGIITDEAKIVKKVFTATNILNSASRYQIDLTELYRIFLESEREGLRIIGFYHSHPYWPASPSALDREAATFPGASYLIYSIPDGEFKSYLFDGMDLRPEAIEVPSQEGAD